MSTEYPEMPSSEQEWRAHWAFYQLTIKQRDAAWREIEHLKGLPLGAAPTAAQPEVRGYVVLVPGGAAGTFEVGATGIIFSDVGQASAEAAWAEGEFGLTGAHVGVVTALSTTTEERHGQAPDRHPA